jgi:hypothetical protein
LVTGSSAWWYSRRRWGLYAKAGESGAGSALVTGRGHGLFYEADFVRRQAVEGVNQTVDFLLQFGGVGVWVFPFCHENLVNDFSDGILPSLVGLRKWCG